MIQRRIALAVSVVLVCMTLTSGHALADYKNFGIYQDTNGSGVLDPGDTFIQGFMNWYTHYSAESSYNYGDHSDPALSGFTDLTGAPYAADHLEDPNNENFSWLPMHDDELHIYMLWAHYNNTDAGELELERNGFALGMIANDYIRGRDDSSPSGGYDLDIAIRNDGTALPQVGLSDDYIDAQGNITGRPPHPGTLDGAALEQEYYKVTDPDLGDPYNHHFEGRWDYTASTGDGGIISGVHNGDYDIDIFPSNIVDSVAGDGLVIRIDPLAFDEVFKIVLFDFGYYNGAVDTAGTVAPAGYDEFNPLGIEIPIGTADDKTFFIASIPEVVPEPTSMLSLLIGTCIIGLVRRRLPRN